MPATSAIVLIITAFLTALLSGIFGMAGGLVLMGVLALIMPVAAVFVTHGILQLVANGWRAFLQREHIVWRIIGWYVISAIAAAALVMAIAIMPSKPILFLLLGCVAMLVWLPKGWIELDATKPLHALISGFSVTLVNLTAGVAGPLLDVFFVRTALTRHQIVATKAMTQVFSHCAKIVVYGGMAAQFSVSTLPPLWVFVIAIPASMLGTVAGGKILDRITDVDFKRWTAWIITLVGLLYFWKAASAW